MMFTSNLDKKGPSPFNIVGSGTRGKGKEIAKRDEIEA
jgi:hypothetical protein